MDITDWDHAEPEAEGVTTANGGSAQDHSAPSGAGAPGSKSQGSGKRCPRWTTKWTSRDMAELAALHAVFGNKWQAIAKRCKRRTATDVKNIFYSSMRCLSEDDNPGRALLRTYIAALKDRGEDPRARTAALETARTQQRLLWPDGDDSLSSELPAVIVPRPKPSAKARREAREAAAAAAAAADASAGGDELDSRGADDDDDGAAAAGAGASAFSDGADAPRRRAHGPDSMGGGQSTGTWPGSSRYLQSQSGATSVRLGAMGSGESMGRGLALAAAAAAAAAAVRPPIGAVGRLPLAAAGSVDGGEEREGEAGALMSLGHGGPKRARQAEGARRARASGSSASAGADDTQDLDLDRGVQGPTRATRGGSSDRPPSPPLEDVSAQPRAPPPPHGPDLGPVQPLLDALAGLGYSSDALTDPVPLLRLVAAAAVSQPPRLTLPTDVLAHLVYLLGGSASAIAAATGGAVVPSGPVPQAQAQTQEAAMLRMMQLHEQGQGLQPHAQHEAQQAQHDMVARSQAKLRARAHERQHAGPTGTSRDPAGPSAAPREHSPTGWEQAPPAPHQQHAPAARRLAAAPVHAPVNLPSYPSCDSLSEIRKQHLMLVEHHKRALDMLDRKKRELEELEQRVARGEASLRAVPPLDLPPEVLTTPSLPPLPTWVLERCGLTRESEAEGYAGGSRGARGGAEADEADGAWEDADTAAAQAAAASVRLPNHAGARAAAYGGGRAAAAAAKPPPPPPPPEAVVEPAEPGSAATSAAAKASAELRAAALKLQSAKPGFVGRRRVIAAAPDDDDDLPLAAELPPGEALDDPSDDPEADADAEAANAAGGAAADAAASGGAGPSGPAGPTREIDRLAAHRNELLARLMAIRGEVLDLEQRTAAEEADPGPGPGPGPSGPAAAARPSEPRPPAPRGHVPGPRAPVPEPRPHVPESNQSDPFAPGALLPPSAFAVTHPILTPALTAITGVNPAPSYIPAQYVYYPDDYADPAHDAAREPALDPALDPAHDAGPMLGSAPTVTSAPRAKLPAAAAVAAAAAAAAAAPPPPSNKRPRAADEPGPQPPPAARLAAAATATATAANDAAANDAAADEYAAAGGAYGDELGGRTASRLPCSGSNRPALPVLDTAPSEEQLDTEASRLPMPMESVASASKLLISGASLLTACNAALVPGNRHAAPVSAEEDACMGDTDERPRAAQAQAPAAQAVMPRAAQTPAAQAGVPLVRGHNAPILATEPLPPGVPPPPTDDPTWMRLAGMWLRPLRGVTGGAAGANQRAAAQAQAQAARPEQQL